MVTRFGMSDNIGILSLDGEWFAAPNSYLKILYEENPTWFKNEIIAEEPRDRNCLFADSYIFVNDGTVITAEDLNVESILEANNDYILVRVSGEAHYPAVGVMDYNGNWVVNPSGDNYDSYRACDNIYFSGHYMVMNMDDVLYYYDLTSNIILEEKPDDLPEQEQPPKDDDDANVNDKIYDITQIKNYR